MGHSTNAGYYGLQLVAQRVFQEVQENSGTYESALSSPGCNRCQSKCPVLPVRHLVPTLSVLQTLGDGVRQDPYRGSLLSKRSGLYSGVGSKRHGSLAYV